MSNTRYTKEDAKSTISNNQHLKMHLLKEADVNHMGQEDIACIMMQNCFLDTAFKVKFGAVKNPPLAALNEIMKSHEAGKKVANMTASDNAIKS